MSSEPLLRLEGIEKSFGEGEGRTHVLAGVDLVLAAGETLAVVGPSGSGKSTLLNIAGTLEQPTRGRVLFDGRDLAGSTTDELARFRNEALGFVFQHHHLLPQLTALENVLVPTLASEEQHPRESEARARELLERVGLAHRVTHRPAELSGGERQRVAVVRALINRPRLVLADEPTGSLDARSAEALGELLLAQSADEGVALLLVTHSTRLAERASSTVRLEEGVLVTPSAAS